MSIETFANVRKGLILDEVDAIMGPEATTAALVFLAALETELSFLLAGTQEVIRARSERAFVHLQRLIVADTEFGAKWQTALREGETSCEKLGSVHLLSHGVFAFKVSGAGERTDLVFNEPLDSDYLIQRFADGVVLTEWKVATAESVAAQLEQARTQAKRYSQGVLGGIELAAYRYLVIVSDDFLPTASGESVDGAVTYRHVNIAVKPATPSRARA